MQEAADRVPLEEGVPSSLVLRDQAAGAETSMGHDHQVVLAESDVQTDRGVACIKKMDNITNVRIARLNKPMTPHLQESTKYRRYNTPLGIYSPKRRLSRS
jgi:hypothetical protein